METIKESQIVFNCMDILGQMGIFAWRNNTGALRDRRGRLVRYGLPGSADILGITKDGRLLAVECKRPSGGRISELQLAFLEKINLSNGIGLIVRSEEDLIKGLEEAGAISHGIYSAGV